MRLITWLTAAFILLSGTVFSQPIFEENFEYSIGVLSTVSPDWAEYPSGSTDVGVVDGNLGYTDYPSSSIGKMIFLDGGASGRSGIQRTFGPITSNKLYISFLITFIDINDLDENLTVGDKLFKLSQGSSSYKAQVYVKKGAEANKINFGISKTTSTSSLQYINTDFNLNQTYLIVVSYEFVSGDNNDVVSLWVNPDLSGTEPSPDLTYSSNADAANIQAILFLQEALSGNAYIDGIRVATTWSEAPLPVELSSFTAAQVDNNVELNWQTAAEISNYGFQVERLIQNQPLANELKIQNWDNVGFVNGHGNSNSTKQYSFTDKYPPVGKIFYRLKQIDTDGNYKYSDAVSVTVNAAANFNLYQNYPNPFNSTSIIKYSIDKNEYVNFVLYSQLGEKIADIPAGIKEPGTYQLTLDLAKINQHISSGVYFLILYSAARSKSIKINYLK